MPIYNEERFIEKALNSLRQQDYPNIQILISDNASTDRTGEICQRAASQDDRIIYERMNENIGAAANFRHVADRADGDYFMWAAGHDEWSPNLVSKSVEILEQNRGAAIAVADSYWIDENGQRQNRDTHYPDTRDQGVIGRFFTVFWGNMHPVLGVIRSEYLHASKGMQDFVGADLVLLSELVLRGDFVRQHDAWWSRREVRLKETHSERMKRYTSAESGQATTMLDGLFPMFRLPFALLETVWMARISVLEKALLLMALLPLMPVRYIIGVWRASQK